MKRINIMQSFQSNKFKYGGYATLLTAIVIVALVVANLVVDQINIKFDLTENQLYSLSDQTKQVLKNLDRDIRIIGLYQAGRENTDVIEILDRYQRESDKITLTTFDPVKYPQLAMKYQEDGKSLDLGSIIVESGDKFKVISQQELYNFGYSAYGQLTIESITVEQRVTGAIQFVTAKELPVVYTLVGHGEATLPTQLQQQFDLENFTVKSLDLMTVDAVPEDAHAVMVISPKIDLNETEEQKLYDYLVNEGRMIFLMDLVNDEQPNFQKLFRKYGVELQHSIIVEGDRSQHAGNPIWLFPKAAKHDIVSPLVDNELKMFIPLAQGIRTTDVKRHSLKVEPLYTTSSNSWAKTDLSTKTLEKESGDPEGPFNVAVAITEQVFEDNKTKETKLVLVSNASFLDPQFYGYANDDFLMNSINWLRERKENITVRPKRVTQTPLNINALQILIWSGVVVILIPLVVFSMGLVVWLRRRHL